MGKLVATNNAASTLLTALGPLDTTLICATGHGSRFPATTGGNYFYCTLTNAVGQFEVVKVTNRLGDTFTVTRAQDNTIGSTWEAGDAFELRVVAAAINEIANVTGSVGAANGIAPLNGVSQVPNANLPIGTANGIAGLDGSMKVAVGNLPVGTANGIAGLDAGAKVPVAQLPAGTANGIAPLDADQQVPVINLPVNEANGICGLGADGKVAGAQLPAMNYLPLSGGTVIGNVTVTGTVDAALVTADAIEATGDIDAANFVGKITPDAGGGSLTKITYSTSDPSGTPVGTGQWWIKHEA
jgi:hypothetical protein